MAFRDIQKLLRQKASMAEPYYVKLWELFSRKESLEPLSGADLARQIALEADEGDADALIIQSVFRRKGLAFRRDAQKSLALLLEAYQRGDMNAALFLGTQALEGVGGPRDSARALAYFEEAREAGVSHADLFLADYYGDGRETEHDAAKAFLYLSHSPFRDDPAYLYYVFKVFDCGGRSVIDQSEAIRCLRRAAAGGCAGAAVALGDLYFFGEYVPRDRWKALEIYKRCLRLGVKSGELLTNISYIYSDGIGVPADLDLAVSVAKRAADRGHGSAIRLYARYLRDGTGVERDIDDAIFILRQAALKGDLEARTELGKLYITDKEARDCRAGVKLLTEAASQNCASAYFALGTVYDYGYGGRRDPEAALRLIIIAAKMGCVEAQLELCDKLVGGQGTPEEQRSAVEMYSKEAAKGYAPSQLCLARLIERGVGGLPDDMDKALRLARQAARARFPEAFGHLGLMTLSSGAEDSVARARDLFRQGVELGDSASFFGEGYMRYLGMASPQDVKEGLARMREGVREGFYFGALYLAKEYLFGQLAPYSRRKARYLLDSYGGYFIPESKELYEYLRAL
ncbi:MAG: hypothetical protein LBO66_04650 [Deltaproteobacteria bacterium]|jgi:TPR repeat protein|nr:hypothetical protein [Deltaproteobacteria bacterium]